jgi:hypothetical protein
LIANERAILIDGSLEEVEVIDFEAIERRVPWMECSQRVGTGKVI